MGTIDKEDLGGRQQIVLEIIWALDNCATTSQIVSKMEQIYHKKMTAQALNTILQQLIDKGLVLRDKVPGKISVYRAVISQREYQVKEVNRMIKRTFNGSNALLFAAMAENGITEEEYKEIQKLIERGGAKC